MHCPNCGTQTSREQKFCRSCGLGLEKVAHFLGEQMPRQLDESLLARKERLERMGVAALSVFGAGVLGMLLYGVVYKVMIVQGRAFEGLAILALLGIVACGLLAAVLFAQANEAGAKRSAGRLQELVPDEAPPELLTEGQPQPLPSVTERTTDLLMAEKKSEAEPVTDTREL